MGEQGGACEFVAKDLILQLDLSLAADINSIDPVVANVMEQARKMGCAAGKEFEVELSLREALANAIEHGAGGDPRKEVQVSVACDKARGMMIVIRDPGDGFDPNELPSPLVGQHVYSSHGRGIYLINRLMDEVRFERGGTEIRMIKS